MDALAQLALMTKAKLVFESPGSFLSFPALSPISYSADELKFGAFTAVETAERLIFSEFSRFANALPSGTIFQPQGDSYLWDAYSQVLKSARLAKGQTTPEQEAAYQQAVSFLSVTDANGWQTDSPALLTYKQYRDVWFGAVQDYKTQQSTAATATDAATQTQWRDVDEPRLRAAVQHAEADWASKGGRAAVEQAQHVQQAYAAASPELTWKAWASGFNPDLDLMTDPNQMAYALTAFAPSDVFDQEWPTFTLTAPEIALLADHGAARADGHLRQRHRRLESGIAVLRIPLGRAGAALVPPGRVRCALLAAAGGSDPAQRRHDAAAGDMARLCDRPGLRPQDQPDDARRRNRRTAAADARPARSDRGAGLLPAADRREAAGRHGMQPQAAAAARPQVMMADRAAMLAPAISIASRQLFRGNSPAGQVAAVAGRQAVPAGHAGKSRHDPPPLRQCDLHRLAAATARGTNAADRAAGTGPNNAAGRSTRQ